MVLKIKLLIKSNTFSLRAINKLKISRCLVNHFLARLLIWYSASPLPQFTLQLMSK